MKPKERKPEIVYRIIQKGNNGFGKAGEAIGNYSRAYCDIRFSLGRASPHGKLSR